MATQTYRKRQRAFEGAEMRTQAVQRFRAESSARAKMAKIGPAPTKPPLPESRQPSKQNTPAQQRAAAKPLAGPTKQQVDRVAKALPTRAQRRARRIDLGDLSRTHQTTRGKRRLSFQQAFLRRTTDSSRARVAKLYGRKPSESLLAKAGLGGRKVGNPVGPGKPNMHSGDGTANQHALAKRRAGAQIKREGRNESMLRRRSRKRYISPAMRNAPRSGNTTRRYL